MIVSHVLVRIRVLRPLQSRSFALLWFGQTISVLGDRMYQTTLPFLVLALGGNAIQLSRVLLFFALFQAMFVLLAGMVVDRVPHRRTMLLSDSVRAVLVALMTILLLIGSLQVRHMYLIAACFGIVSAFFLPAARGLVPQLVSADQLVAANSLRSLSTQMNGILGPLIGGVLVVAGGAAVAIGANAVSFVLSAVCLFAIPVSRGTTALRRRPVTLTSARQELIAGFRFVAATQWLFVFVLLSSLSDMCFAGAMSVALPLLAQARLGGAIGYGWMLAAIASGSALAVVLLGSRRQIRHRGILYWCLVALSGLGMMLLAASRTIPQAIAAGVCIGACIAAFLVVMETTVQQLVPPEFLGRVTSLEIFGSLVLLPPAYALIGMLITSDGPRVAILVSGIGLVLLALLALCFRSVRMVQ